MTHHISKRVLKDKVLDSPRSHKMKRTPLLHVYIEVLLLQNRKNLTVNHEDALKSIQDRIAHVFDTVL